MLITVPNFDSRRRARRRNHSRAAGGGRGWAVRLLGVVAVVSAPSARAEVTWGQQTVEAPLEVARCGGADAPFGAALSIDADTLVVSAPSACGADGVSSDAGAIVVFDREAQSWVQGDVIRAAGAQSGDRFGAAQALSSDGILAVGAPGVVTDGAPTGAVALLVRGGRRFQSFLTLLPPSGAPEVEAGGGFGESLAIADGVVVAGVPGAAPLGVAAAGAAYVYFGTDFSEGRVVRAQTPTPQDRFGQYVATDGHHLAISSTTSVHLFRMGEISVIPIAVLDVAQAVALAFSGPRLAVARETGEVRVFYREPNTENFVLEETLGVAGPSTSSLAWDESQLVVRDANDVSSWVATGAVTNGLDWQDDGVVEGAPGGTAQVAAGDGFVAVNTGADVVSTFRKVSTNGEPCGNGDQCLSGFCVDGVCCETLCGAGQEDCLACSIAAGGLEDGACSVAVAGTVCRGAVGGCDRAEVCNGIAATCPGDSLESQGFLCREAAGPCDLPEVCAGGTAFCPADAFANVGVVCRPSVGLCDVPETCDGLRAVCPLDRTRQAGTECRARLGACDVAESCDGVRPACPVDGFVPFGTECRSASSQCDATERCTGLSGDCPANVFVEDGTACVDGDACTEGDACFLGVCQSGEQVCEAGALDGGVPQFDPAPMPAGGDDAGVGPAPAADGCRCVQDLPRTSPPFAVAFFLLVGGFALRRVRRRHGATALLSACSLAVTCLAADVATAQDIDGDGVPNASDICPGDDAIDSDNDGTPDACDCAPNDAQRHKGAADTCDFIDNNCDGLVDRRSVLHLNGWDMFRKVQQNEAQTGPSGTLYSAQGSTQDPVFAAEPGPGAFWSQLYFEHDLDLQTRDGVREAEVRFSYEHVSPNQNLQVVFRQGDRGIGVHLFPREEGATTLQARVMNGIFLDEERLGGDLWFESSAPFRMPVLSDTRRTFAFKVKATATETTFSIRSLDTGLTQPDIVLPAAQGLDPNAPWSIALNKWRFDHPYYFYSLDVAQPFPDVDEEDTTDADQDGYPASCDCNDTDPAIHPGAIERCDGFDTDCRPSLLDEDQAVSAVGAGFGNQVFAGDVVWWPNRPLRLDETGIEVTAPTSPLGEAQGVVQANIRPNLVLPTDSFLVSLDLESTRPNPGDLNRIGLVVARRPFFESYQRGHALWIEHSDAGYTLQSTYRIDVFESDQPSEVNQAGPIVLLSSDEPLPNPLLIEFQVRRGEGVFARTYRGITPGEWVTITDQSFVPQFLLLAADAASRFVVRDFHVAQMARDADGDGICDVLDRCAGYDGDVDADGDGARDRCDCNDANPGIFPGAPEVCNGIDEDCDGAADLFQVAGGRGTDLVRKASLGQAAWTVDELTVLDSTSVDFRGSPTAPYRETIPLSADEDGRAQYRILTEGENIDVRIHDGVRALDFARETSTGKFLLLASRVNAAGVVLGPLVPFLGIDGVGGAPIAQALIASPEGKKIQFDRPLFINAAAENMGITLAGDTLTLPANVGPDFSRPLEMMLFPFTDPDNVPATTVLEASVSTSLRDADLDLVCDAQDVCPFEDDRLDSDADGIPDACDVCFGVDGQGDLDGDGYPAGCDCNDLDANVHPGVADTCNARDDNCDGVTDRHQAYRVRGPELRPRMLQGVAAGSGDRFIEVVNGSVAKLGRGPAAMDVVFREPMQLQAGTNNFVIDADFPSQVGIAQNFLVGVASRGRFFGTSFRATTEAVSNRWAAVTGIDLGTRLSSVARGAPTSAPAGAPFRFAFHLDDDPRIEVLTGTGQSFTIRPNNVADVAALDDNLAFVLVAEEPADVVLFKSARVEQRLEDGDGDGVCNAIDVCANVDDDGPDADADGFPDECDRCPIGSDAVDADGDGVPDACDSCEGADDALDSDADGIADGCDACPDDYANDNDGDGVCDLSDVCLGGDDSADADNDGVPDACDDCPNDANDDSDEDSTCDSLDLCIGQDASGDQDGDGYCGNLDCDDTRASIFPGADEICDGFDSNCNGALREDELDSDNDGVIDCMAAPAAPTSEPEPSSDDRDAACGCDATPSSTPSPLALFFSIFLAVVCVRRHRERG